MSPRWLTGAALTCCVAILSTACGTSDPGGDDTSAGTETTTVSMRVTVEPPPHQPARAGITVEYDPCFTLPDSIVDSLGFATESRERNDYVFDDYAFIGCQFNRYEKAQFSDRMDRVGGLNVWSSGITLDEFREKDFENARDITVANRQAMSYTSRSASACSIAMTGPDGVIQVRMSGSPQTDWDACAHIHEAAAAVEATLPEQK